MRKSLFLIALLSGLHFGFAQKRDITLEDIWTKNTFPVEHVYGLASMADGQHYTSILWEGKTAYSLVKYNYKTGKKVATLVKSEELVPEGSSLPISMDEYSFSMDESKLLIATKTEKVYRHSKRADYYVWDLKDKKLKKITDGEKQMYASFSPDGSKVAFVRSNNIFVKNLSTGKEMAITNDGKQNNIINGATDWVYEEEFSFDQAYQWSPDGSRIAFYRFDESRVKEFEMSEYNDSLYPTVYRFKYPKAGEANSIVSIHLAEISNGKITAVNTGSETNQYIPRIQWTNNPNTLSLLRMNRLQNTLELLFANAATGDTKVILTEKSNTFIEITDNLTFSSDDKSFIWSSDRDGFNHLYLYSMKGDLMNQVTKGNWDVLDFKGMDESTKTIFYISDEAGVTGKNLYSIHMNGTGKKLVSTRVGTNTVDFSNGNKYYINTYTDISTPPYITLHNADGEQIRVLEDNASLKKKLAEYNLATKEFFSFKTKDSIELNGWIMKPVNFDASKKYPVLLTFYGGPHNNEVKNDWEGSSYLWHSLLTQKGYIVACVDNRGTEGRGRDFKKCTYKQLGNLETQDQIESAKYLGKQSYIDKTRIGVQGWSFGAYLSSLCMTKGADYFKAGIAVAPVTSWRFYDTIYTERYLSTPQGNPKGYDENSPINFVNLMKGKYLLIHGSADDNVHLQNTMEMSRALIKANKQFEEFIYPDKNHGISGGSTRIHLYTQMTNFIINNL